MWVAWSVYTSNRTNNVFTPPSAPPPDATANTPCRDFSGLSQDLYPCPPPTLYNPHPFQPAPKATLSGGSLSETAPSAKNLQISMRAEPTDLKRSRQAATKKADKRAALPTDFGVSRQAATKKAAKRAARPANLTGSQRTATKKADKRAAGPTDLSSSRQAATKKADKRRAGPTDLSSGRQAATKKAKKRKKLVDDRTNSGQTGNRGLESQVSWDRHFTLLCAFKERYGHLVVPTYYLAKSPINLSKWTNEQRKFYANFMAGKDEDAWITKERIVRLNSIGFNWCGRDVNKDWSCHVEDTGPNWDRAVTSAWERNFELMRSFQRQVGHCCIPSTFEVASVKLGKWAGQQRTYYKKVMKEGHSSSEKIDRLNSIGFDWSSQEPWDHMLKHLKAFQRKYDHCRVPKSYVAYSFERGPLKVGPMKLGQWVIDQRRVYKKLLAKKEKLERSTQHRYSLLKSIGFFDMQEEKGNLCSEEMGNNS